MLSAFPIGSRISLYRDGQEALPFIVSGNVDLDFAEIFGLKGYFSDGILIGLEITDNPEWIEWYDDEVGAIEEFIFEEFLDYGLNAEVLVVQGFGRPCYETARWVVKMVEDPIARR